MGSVRPIPPVGPEQDPTVGPKRGEVVPLADRRTVVVVHQPPRRTAPMVTPMSRHRREESPGCMRALLGAATAVVAWALAWARRKAAHLCHRLITVRTACGAAAA